jgi:hypothetical protein
MSWKSVFAASGAICLFACGPGEAQTAQVPSFRSPSCNAFCDLYTALRDGLPSAQRAAQLQQNAQQQGAQTPPAPQAAAPVHKSKAPFHKAREAARLPVDGFRLYASGGVTALQDLQGQSVSLGLSGSRTEALAHKALAEAGVTVREVPLDADNAFDALGIGAVKAIAVSGGRSYAMMDEIPARYGVHRLRVPSRLARRSTERTASLSSRER